jgi:hypothetical protein
MIIKLNKAEQVLAKYLAQARHDNARSKGKPNLKMGNQSDWETDLEGIGGELAACKHFGVYPDTEINLTSFPKFDLITKKGNKIDVKTTKYKNGKLLATKKKRRGECDAYVLVVGEFPNYELVGWASDSELLDPKNIVDLGHGEGYALTQEQLRRFK